MGLKIQLQFVKSRHACGFALALPRPRSRGPHRFADMRPLGLQVNVWWRVNACCLAAHLHVPEKRDHQQVRAHGGLKKSHTHTSRAMTNRPHWCASSFTGRRKRSSDRGRTSLACWLKTDTHVQKHTVKFEIAREKHVRAATWMRELWGTPMVWQRQYTKKKTGMRAQPHLVVAGSWLPKRDLSQLGHSRTLVSLLL